MTARRLDVFGLFCWIIASYLLGSLPWGVLIAKFACNKDPRLEGSCSTGATNVSRLCGFGWGVLTLACDVGKGLVAVLVAQSLEPSATYVTLCALASVLGHIFSCFNGFRGGKAVATTIGVVLPLAFWQLAASALLCVLVIWRSGYVSLGSLTLVTALPFFLAISACWQWLALASCLFVLVVVRHKDNILRLLTGTEKSWLRSRHQKEKKRNK